jgi:histone H3/H4
MPRKGNIIPKAPIGRIVKNAGAKRVSDEALEELSLILQTYAEKISGQAIKIAKHSGRRTILESDLKLALK